VTASDRATLDLTGASNRPRSYRKRPVLITAMLLTPSNHDDVMAWVGEPTAYRHVDGRLRIATLEGDMVATDGDFIIRGIAGESYPCKPDIFQASYELAINPRTGKDDPDAITGAGLVDAPTPDQGNVSDDTQERD